MRGWGVVVCEVVGVGVAVVLVVRVVLVVLALPAAPTNYWKWLRNS